jgi:hypothetical protein
MKTGGVFENQYFVPCLCAEITACAGTTAQTTHDHSVRFIIPAGSHFLILLFSESLI